MSTDLSGKKLKRELRDRPAHSVTIILTGRRPTLDARYSGEYSRRYAERAWWAALAKLPPRTMRWRKTLRRSSSPAYPPGFRHHSQMLP